MLRTAKAQLRRWLPPIATDALCYAKAMQLFLRRRSLLQRNAELRGRYSGESVYVLGNGPSLNNFDLSSIRGKRVITMNHFELHPLKDQFDIVAHCIGEPYKSSTWEDPTPMLDGVKARTYWLRAEAAPLLEEFGHLDLRFYLPGVCPTATLLQGGDLTGIALQYQSTSQMAITVALFLGFDDIYLLGFDHDWLATRGHSPHFYAERDGVDKADFSGIPYIDMIRISLQLFQTYTKLEQVASRRGARIWNLSQPSFLDVFPRRPAHHRDQIRAAV